MSAWRCAQIHKLTKLQIGIEYDSAVYERARNAVAAQNLADKVALKHGNVLEEEFEDATAIFMYLLPAGMRLLKDRLTRLLDNGCRIVSYGTHACGC